MFGMYGIGSPFFSSICFGGGFGFVDSGMGLMNDVSCGMWSGAMALCNGVGSMPYGSPQGCRNYIGNLIDWRRACLARSRNKPQVDDLPERAKSPDAKKRIGEYLSQDFYNGSLKGVDQEDVIRSILGPNASAVDKDAFRKKDNILRAVVQKVVGEWMHDPKARGQFLRKWEMAKTDAERARALLDPMGDGAYLQTLAQLGVPGALNEREDNDTKWQKIANWFDSQVESGVLNGLGAEAVNITRAEGWKGDSVLGTSDAKKSREDYVSQLVDKGYTKEEADSIMSPSNMTEEEAEEIMRNMNDQRQSRSLIESKENDIKQEKESLKDEAYNKKENAAQKRQKEEQIRAAETELARMKAERAKQFLQDYMKVAKARFGKTAQDFGYEAGKLPDGVTDVGSAVAWVYNKLGRNFTAPAVTETQSGTPGNTPASSATTGNKGSSSALPTKTGEKIEDQASGKTFYKLESPFYGVKKDDPKKRYFEYAIKNDRGQVTDYCESVDVSTCVPKEQITRAPTSDPQIVENSKRKLTPSVPYNNVNYNWEFRFKNEFGEVDTYYSPNEPALTEESMKTWIKKSVVDAAKTANAAEEARSRSLRSEVKSKIKSLVIEKPVPGTRYPTPEFTVDSIKFKAEYEVDFEGNVKVITLMAFENGSWVNKTAWYNGNN